MNANDFNLILWAMVFEACAALIIWGGTGTGSRLRWPLTAGALFVLICLCMRSWASECWL